MPVEKSVRNISFYLGAVSVVTLLIGVLLLLVVGVSLSTGSIVDTGSHSVTYSTAVTPGFFSDTAINYSSLSTDEQEIVDEALENGSVVVDSTSELPSSERNSIVGVDDDTGEEQRVPMFVTSELYDSLFEYGVVLLVGSGVSFIGYSSLVLFGKEEKEE